MLEPLSIQLLGGFHFTCGKFSLDYLNSPRIQTFLAYLTIHSSRSVTRQEIAFLFWPDSNENQARTNLRQLIYRLRQLWPEAPLYLDFQETSLQWRDTGLVKTDISAYLDAINTAKQKISFPEKKMHLSEAVRLYQGDLYPESYEDWVIPYRQHFHQSILTVLTELITLHEAEKDYDRALVYADQLRKIDSLHELAYQHLMRLYSLVGNRGKALQVYHELSTMLQDEFAAEPSEETKSLYERIQSLNWKTENRASYTFPLFGREMQWQAILNIWNGLMTGSHFILIKGEAGIGKSKLAEEFLAWVSHQGYRTTLARCYPGEEVMAYAPITGWLREIKARYGFQPVNVYWLREISRIFPELLVEYPSIQSPEPLTESGQRQKFSEALARVILGDSSQAKSKILSNRFLLVIDDLQWCDVETLKWVEYFLRFDLTKTILIIATYRDEGIIVQEDLHRFLQALAYSGNISEITLSELDQIAVTGLASYILNQPLDQVQSAKMYAETDGNPLFVLEMAQAWKQGSFVFPAKLQGVIETRLARYSATVRELADLVAVIGREFDVSVLVEASGLPEDQVIHYLDEMLRSRLLREQSDGTLDFTHAKVREVVYQLMSVTRRNHLHRRVAKSLLSLAENIEIGAEQWVDLQSGQIAWHFAEGGQPYQAFLYYFRAGNHSARIFAYQKAENLYAQAIQMANRIKWSGKLLAQCFSSRGRMLEHLGRFTDAERVYGELLVLAEEHSDFEMQCIAITRLVACYIEPSMIHNLDRADRMIVKGLELARKIGAFEQEAQILWSQLLKASHYGSPEEAQQAGQLCVDVARANGLNDILATALHDLSLNLRLNGEVERGNLAAQEAEKLFTRAGNLNLLADHHNQNALISFLHAELRDSSLQLAEAVRISQKIENRWNLAYAKWIQGSIHEAQGDFLSAQSSWEESIQIGEEAGFLMSLTTVKLQYGHMLRQQGHFQHALRLHQEALEVCLQRALFLLQSTESQLALDWFALGDPGTGERYVLSALNHKRMGTIGSGLCLPYLAMANVEWASHTGNWDHALLILNMDIEEAIRRKLKIHELHLEHQKVRVLRALNLADQADGNLKKLVDAIRHYDLNPRLWNIHSHYRDI